MSVENDSRKNSAPGAVFVLWSAEVRMEEEACWVYVSVTKPLLFWS